MIPKVSSPQIRERYDIEATQHKREGGNDQINSMSPLPLPEPLRGEFSVSEAQRRLQSFAGEAVPLVWKRDAEHGGREILDSRSTLQCSSTTCSLFCQVKWAHEQTCLEHSCLQRPCTRAQVAETMPKALATTFSTQKGAMKALKAFAEKVLGPL